MGKKKASRRGGEEGSLSITSMMDMMTIILVFLLKSYNTDDISVAASEDLQVPTSTALATPKLAVNVVVSRKEITVDGNRVLGLEMVQDENGAAVVQVPADETEGQLISSLFSELEKKAAESKELGQRTGQKDFEFKGEILLQCDRRLPFTLVRQVMFTAGQAQFGNFRFVVIKGGS